MAGDLPKPDSPTPPSRDLILLQSAELQALPLAPERAGELAVEVGRLNGTVLAAADRDLTFFDEPAAFLVALSELRDDDA